MLTQRHTVGSSLRCKPHLGFAVGILKPWPSSVAAKGGLSRTGTGMIIVWQGNEAWEVQRACKRVLLVGWTIPEEKSVARAKDEGSVQIVSLGFCPWAPITENQTPGKWESGKAGKRESVLSFSQLS